MAAHGGAPSAARQGDSRRCRGCALVASRREASTAGAPRPGCDQVGPMASQLVAELCGQAARPRRSCGRGSLGGNPRIAPWRQLPQGGRAARPPRQGRDGHAAQVVHFGPHHADQTAAEAAPPRGLPHHRAVPAAASAAVSAEHAAPRPSGCSPWRGVSEGNPALHVVEQARPLRAAGRSAFAPGGKPCRSVEPTSVRREGSIEQHPTVVGAGPPAGPRPPGQKSRRRAPRACRALTAAWAQIACGHAAARASAAMPGGVHHQPGRGSRCLAPPCSAAITARISAAPCRRAAYAPPRPRGVRGAGGGRALAGDQQVLRRGVTSEAARV